MKPGTVLVTEPGTELGIYEKRLRLVTNMPTGSGPREIAAHLRALAGGFERQAIQ